LSTLTVSVHTRLDGAPVEVSRADSSTTVHIREATTYRQVVQVLGEHLDDDETARLHEVFQAAGFTLGSDREIKRSDFS